MAANSSCKEDVGDLDQEEKDSDVPARISVTDSGDGPTPRKTPGFMRMTDLIEASARLKRHYFEGGGKLALRPASSRLR